MVINWNILSAFCQQVHVEEQCLFLTISSLISVPTILKNIIHVGDVCFLCHLSNVPCETDILNLYYVVFSDNFHTVKIIDNNFEEVNGGHFTL
jgi:hypothetical protein